ncbi:MAG: hypothetical protein M5U12_22620 [Verrucomicrobia bacterium]|nr:hypothetical protein [Verrucomicrobiota bacterium]
MSQEIGRRKGERQSRRRALEEPGRDCFLGTAFGGVEPGLDRFRQPDDAELDQDDHGRFQPIPRRSGGTAQCHGHPVQGVEDIRSHRERFRSQFLEVRQVPFRKVGDEQGVEQAGQAGGLRQRPGPGQGHRLLAFAALAQGQAQRYRQAADHIRIRLVFEFRQEQLRQARHTGQARRELEVGTGQQGLDQPVGLKPLAPARMTQQSGEHVQVSAFKEGQRPAHMGYQSRLHLVEESFRGQFIVGYAEPDEAGQGGQDDFQVRMPEGR